MVELKPVGLSSTLADHPHKRPTPAGGVERGDRQRRRTRKEPWTATSQVRDGGAGPDLRRNGDDALSGRGPDLGDVCRGRAPGRRGQAGRPGRRGDLVGDARGEGPQGDRGGGREGPWGGNAGGTRCSWSASRDRGAGTSQKRSIVGVKEESGDVLTSNAWRDASILSERLVLSVVVPIGIGWRA